MFRFEFQILQDVGFYRYEVSNFARTKVNFVLLLFTQTSLVEHVIECVHNYTCCVLQEAESIHNKNYWKGGQYIGVGPGKFHLTFSITTCSFKYRCYVVNLSVCCSGAHGRFSVSNIREARVQTPDPNSWMLEVEKHGHATRKISALTTEKVCDKYAKLSFFTGNWFF